MDLSRQGSSVEDLASQKISGNFWRFCRCYKCPTIFGWGWCSGTWRVEAKDAAKHSIGHRMAPRMKKNCLVQSTSGVCCSENPALRARYLETIILTAGLRSRCYWAPFTEKGIEAQEAHVTHPKRTPRIGWSPLSVTSLTFLPLPVCKPLSGP